jgi:hypothetical protein
MLVLEAGGDPCKPPNPEIQQSDNPIAAIAAFF